MLEYKEIINLIYSYYENAFNNLVYLTFGLVAFIGAVIPSIIAFLQNKRFKIESIKLSEELESQSEKIKNKLEKEIKETIKKQVSESKKENDKEIDNIKEDLEIFGARSEAKLYHVIAGLTQEKKNHVGTLDNSLYSAILYLKAKDEANMQKITQSIKLGLDNITNKNILEDNNISNNFDSLIEKLNELNEHGTYTSLLKELETKMENAKKRKKSTK